MINEVFTQIDSLTESYVDVWEDVCNLESPSNNKVAVDKVGEYFIELSKKHDWDIEVFEHKVFGNVISVTMNKDSLMKPVVISGHIDTVHPIGSFGTPAVRRGKDKLYGPGTLDCKGGVVAGFLAMDALAECGFKARPVMMLLQSNEEIGSGLNNKEPIQYICEKSKNAVAFLNLEGHEKYFDGKACLIRKGIAVFVFEVKGIAAHASYCAHEGANAIAEAAHKIIEIEKFKDDNGITCNCGIISGGTTTNTIPASCTFKVDVRFSTDSEYQKIVEYLQKIANTVYVDGCTCELIQTNLRPAMELTDKNIELLNKSNDLFIQNGLSTLEIGKRSGGSDAADVTSFGIPCIDSLGVKGERAHSIEEYGLINSLPESAKRLATIICGI